MPRRRMNEGAGHDSNGRVTTRAAKLRAQELLRNVVHSDDEVGQLH